jgi:AcrR family transcriptional regulator
MLVRDKLGTVMDTSRAATGADSHADPVPGTGGPRSEPTRRAILAAARAIFAARGYEGTTIRAVAARAGVDASMVMRYFQSKAGLFTAAVTMDLRVPDLRSAPASQHGELLVRHFISRWEDPLRGEELIALLRTAVTSETVASQVQAILGQLVTEPIAALGDERAAERGALIAAQLLGLAMCRYVLRLEPLASMPSDDVAAAVVPSVQQYLTDLRALAESRSAQLIDPVGEERRMLRHSFRRDHCECDRIFGVVEQVPFVEERRPDRQQRRRLHGRIATVGHAAHQVIVGDVVAKEVEPLDAGPDHILAFRRLPILIKRRNSHSHRVRPVQRVRRREQVGEARPQPLRYRWRREIGRPLPDKRID